MPYEKQEEVVRMHAEGLSPAKISESTGVGLNTIPFILYEAGRSINYRKVDKVVRLYSEGYSLPRIAKILGTSLGYVKRTIKKEKMRGNIESRDHVGSYKLTDAQIAQAVKMRESGCSAAQIAKIFGVTGSTIRNYVRREKQDDGKEKPAQFASGSYILTKEQLAAAARMRKEGQTIQKIAESFGVSQTTIGRHLRNAGVYKGATITKKKEDEIVRLYNNGYSVRRSTEKTGASTRTIKNIISEAISSGKATRRAHGGSYKLTNSQADEIVSLYEAGKSVPRIAEEFEVSEDCITRRLKTKGVNIRSHRLSAKARDEIIALYKAGAPVRQIAEKFNIKKSTVFRVTASVREGMEARGSHIKGHRLSAKEKEEIIALYKAGAPVRQIAEKFNVSESSIFRITAQIRENRKAGGHQQ